MDETRAKIVGGCGAVIIAAAAAGVTHYFDNVNWSKQHTVERQEYRELQAEKVFDSVTTRISRYLAANEMLNIYEQGADERRKATLYAALLQRLQESQMAFPLDRVRVQLYFSDSTYGAFERTNALMGWSFRESHQNLQPGTRQSLDSTVALRDLLTKVATLMASELGSGTPK